MEDQMAVSSAQHNNNSIESSYVVNIYPLNCYYFGSKEAVLPKTETTYYDQIQKWKANYSINGMRTCVAAVMLVELFNQPHLLVLQVRNSFFKLPGGRLRPGESDIEGLKRKLSSKLSSNENGIDNDWEVGECLGMWWRPDFETSLCPYLSPHVQSPKECLKLFLVKLPMTRRFIVPQNLKLLAVPVFQVHDNVKTYGSIISEVPGLLSRFSFNMIQVFRTMIELWVVAILQKGGKMKQMFDPT
ncbi:Cleavage/polyadenylation specificity factor subunit 5 [Macleaya cordata]|uniref:Pre-mRNA cleavage factor Im 25 kDa subunit n=1 Tax=Macleaya cordata TaxID=56857 RepID=A0A200Q210_MACCD|nr:Cleavage/polyadenylation specificity factor subunit 5 [Macleaya cordata]